MGNEEKVQYLVETFDIPRNRIFHSRNTSFLLGLMRETDNKGVDIVLNSLSGELLHASWKCAANFGKMIEIGKRDFIGFGRLNMDLFEANRSFCGMDLAQVCSERPAICCRSVEVCSMKRTKHVNRSSADCSHSVWNTSKAVPFSQLDRQQYFSTAPRSGTVSDTCRKGSILER